MEKNNFLGLLNKKFDCIISFKFDFMADKNFNKAIQITAKIILINYISESKDEENKGDDFIFFENRIKKLNLKIKSLIFFEILKLDNEDNIFELEKYIFNELKNELNKESDINYFLKIIDSLKNNEKNIVLQKLIKLIDNNLFTVEQFFSKNKNLIISLLYRLNENGILRRFNNFFSNLESLLDRVRRDLDGNIKKRTLDEFFKNDEVEIEERLGLIKIIFNVFNASETYNKLKHKYNEINDIIIKLEDIKENLIIYHSEAYSNVISELIHLIESFHNNSIKKSFNDINSIKKFYTLFSLVDEIKKVKNFLLFNIIYDMIYDKNKDQNYSFNETFSIIDEIGNLLKKNNNINEIYNKYKIFFIKIKEKVGNNEEKINNFIKSLINYYNIKNDLIIDEFNILFKSKKYEVEINSIIYFFKYFETNNEYWNKILPEEYQNLSTKDYPEIKRILLELRQNNIYNYQNMQDYNKLFLCLYNKKEAMDFLISKRKEDLKVLKNKIELNENIINIQDINDIEKCLGEINRMKQLRNNNKIFNYIKNMNYNIIEKFIKYSNIYMFIIEFDRNNYDFERTNKIVCDILKEASFNITQDKEEFIYIGNDNKERNISLEELVELKNKIYLINKNEKMIFFKNIILNLENILKHIFILRNKGSNLPINIIIKINLKNDEPSAIYYLYDKKETLENIMVFLSNAEKAYLIELDIFYKNKMNLRFLYGKQFRNIIKHLENKSNINIDSLLRYILNNQNTNKHIKDEYKIKNIDVNDYINQYEMYYKTVFEEISQYISYIFNVNRKTIEEHYNNIKIKSEYIIK